MSAADEARHHASEARRWADAADREAVHSGHTPDEETNRRAELYAQVSQAHSLAALSTLVAGDYLDVRTTPG